MAVGERDLQGRIARNHAESVIGEMKVADDFGPKHAGDVRRSGSTAAGRDLLGDTAPADDVAAFQDEGGVSSAGEIGGRGQAVVASADNDGVVQRL